MKKFLSIFSAVLITSTMFFFTGCNSQNKTLAKNIDNTITSLIYSACSMDWVQESSLSELENNMNSTSPADIDNDIQLNTDKTFAVQENNNINTYPINNNAYINENTYVKKYYSPKPVRSINNNFRYNLPVIKRNAVQKNLQKNQIINNNIKANYIQNANNTIKQLQTVTYSTDFLADSSREVQSKINQLIKKRSNILMLINDLYNNNIQLTQEDTNAINAYMNIIKESTSYLNANKGIIENQLAQANDLLSEKHNSPLVNAYLIRTNEAIETRFTKLDSAALAIDAIYEILKTKAVTPSAFINDFYSQNFTNNNNIAQNLQKQAQYDENKDTCEDCKDNRDKTCENCLNNDDDNTCEDCKNNSDIICEDYEENQNAICEDCKDKSETLCDNCENSHDNQCENCENKNTDQEVITDNPQDEFNQINTTENNIINNNIADNNFEPSINNLI